MTRLMTRRIPSSTLTLVLLAAPTLLQAGGDAEAVAREAPADEAAYRAELEEWQAQRQAGMSDPEGWRALVGLDWLRPGETTVGRAEDNDLVLPTKNAPAHLGTFIVQDTHTVEDPEVRFRPAEGVEVRVGGEPVTEEIRLATDMEESTTVLEAGSLTLHVIEREDENGVRLALRSRDREHPRLAEPPELSFYPIDPTWRLEARFEPYDPPRPIPIVNVLGMVAEVPSPGALVFRKNGTEHRIDVLDGGEEQLFLIFGDRTNGKTTYGAGRYLYAARPGAGEALGDHRVVLDFNRAYNPPCAFTTFATCPLPPRQNKLKLAVTAGERYDQEKRAKGYAPEHR